MIYVKNKELYAEIVISLNQDRLTASAQRMFILIVDNLTHKFKYSNPDDRFDCKQTALLDLFSNWRNFNPVYKNAFAYYSEIGKRGMARGWAELKRQKGNKGGHILHYSIESSNDGEGIYGL